ncbi:MAG: aminotransferase class I/II-fold pyridoxal phosphate-dependent enzyme [Alphaproteobacteria bacterium]|jgi:dTDP-4-amino-4,6-dideoxygalactose transaminase|nr:aminotransferase class I/II-fold pyridoxal phosphate-dependent enzyme [Alphaproteobacteria bacterium]HIA61092.1 aminotransferase class I/II-fold pyridoxal phosphate-dependent enzyme [Pelagibacterales bacterium]
MYEIGNQEVQAIKKIISKGKLFRYLENSECDFFEKNYSKYLSIKHTALASSGTAALTAALVGLKIGPGDEVLIPAHTYMATAMSVLSVGAIPIIVDIDETLTIDPKALEDACGPLTRAAIVVHMWGTTCNMKAIMKIAKKKNLFVIEDACQGVGGGYEKKMLGTIGHVGAFSFNYYKNMTSGEGGAVVSNNKEIIERAKCAIDPCHFYWQGRKNSLKPFAANGSRASEFMGALLNVQLKRLPGMIKKMRAERNKILSSTQNLSNMGIKHSPLNSKNYDCGNYVFFKFNNTLDAENFTSIFPAPIAGKTGRHNYTEWDQILLKEGSFHQSLNPYKLSQNKKCRMNYSKNMCKSSLEILDKTIMIPTDPKNTKKDINNTIRNIKRAALAYINKEHIKIKQKAIDKGKFDYSET